MVRVDGGYNVTSEGKVRCSLYADTSEEVGSGMQIQGLPEQYWDKLDAGCDVFTSHQELGMLDSSGNWNF